MRLGKTAWSSVSVNLTRYQNERSLCLLHSEWYQMRFRVLNTLAGILALLSVLLWIPFLNWYIEIFNPTMKELALNAFLCTLLIILFKSTSHQPRIKKVTLRTIAVFLFIAGSFSFLMLAVSSIPAPQDIFLWNTVNHVIQVGSHYVEARRTRLYNLYSGSGEIIVREIKPLSWGLRLVRQPIAVEQDVTRANLRKIDDDSFSYQFVSVDTSYASKKVQFHNARN